MPCVCSSELKADLGPEVIDMRKRSVSRWIVLASLTASFLFAAVLAGCGSAEPTERPMAQATLRPTFTSGAATDILPTAVPTEETTPTESPEVSPSATAEPSPTEAPSTEPPPTSTSTTTPVPSSTPTSPPPPSAPVTMNSPDFGIQAFLWWRPDIAHRDLGLIRDAGFTWVKQGFAWREIEGAGKGIFDWSVTDRIVDQVEQHGLKLIVRVDNEPAWAKREYRTIPAVFGEVTMGPPRDLQDYADFMYALASRYRGRIQIYQVWNEPNLAREWAGNPPSPQQYTQLLKIAYQAVKRADPNALVISAGLAPTTLDSEIAMPDLKFIQGMYSAGAKPYFDALGAHGAGYKAAPETDPATVASDPSLNNNDPSPTELKRIYCFRHVEDVRQVMVDHGDASKQIVLLEFGWTIDERPDSPYYWHRVQDQTVQGQYMMRAYQWAKEHWRPWIGVMSLIYMPNVDWTPDDEQYWWSVMEPSWIDELRLKAPYVILCDYIRQQRGLERCRYAP